MSRWQCIQDLFERAAALPASDREAVLRQEHDVEVRAEVAALLAADGLAPALLDGTAAGWMTARESAPDPRLLIGTRVGAYHLDAVLAEGGMGDVYRATRTLEGTAQQVVVKVLRTGLHEEDRRRRFQREQSSLAALRHPYIVTLLDTGTLADGRPFLVMEAVEGEPVTRWCETAARSIRDRLEVFLKILAAVQHAHQNLIVHLDLKPSNVLVTRDGAPKLLDFGIASLLTEITEAPEHGGSPARPPLTHAYASPEQLRGETVTTRADVYALGALLSEMLALTPAFEGAAVLDPERAPRAPSTLARSRAHRQALTGDLDAIVLRALQRDPGRRFASVEQFAAEIRRHLDGHPVDSRQPTLRYRAGKWARRNPWLLSGAAIALLAIALGWAGSEIRRQRARAEAGRGWGAHAQVKLASDHLAGLAVELSTAGDGWQRVVDAHAAALPTAFPDCPESEGLVALALAQLYVAHDRPTPARPLLEHVLDLVGRGVLSRREDERARALLDSLP